MKGYPKRLNTKADYEYVRANFEKEQWLPDWKKLLDTTHDWVPTGTVKSAKAGTTDDTHKVVESTEQGEDGTDVAVCTQYELQAIPTCRLARLGFDEEYVKEVVAAAEA